MKTDFYNRNMFYRANAGTLRAAGILRRNMTKAELILWNKLKDKKYLYQNFADSILSIFLLLIFIAMNINWSLKLMAKYIIMKKI